MRVDIDLGRHCEWFVLAHPDMDQAAYTSLPSLSLGAGIIVITKGQQMPVMMAQDTAVCQEIK